MPLVNTKEMFKKAYKEGYAVGCFNVDSIPMIQAVLTAAEENNSPVIISISEGSREFMHPGNIKDLVSIIAKDITIPYAIHLDHGKSVEVCKSCIDEGFSSVMIDASMCDFEENIRRTKEVVEYAHKHGATVEGELGGIGGSEDGHSIDQRFVRFTNPKQVKEYYEKTGVDCLAVAVGTCHGSCKFKPGEKQELQWDLIDEIGKLVPELPLVLHGSSSIPSNVLDTFNNYGGDIHNTIGVPEDVLRRASKTAVCKINIGTDFRMAYVGGLRKSLTEIKNKFEPRNFLVPAKEAAKELVSYKVSKVFMSAGHGK